jgi:small neutral amino acid transporter SnatA (MarC family)
MHHDARRIATHPTHRGAPGYDTGGARIMSGTEIFSASVLLILVIDPFGNVPLVVSAMKAVPPSRRARVVARECIAAYAILLAFMIGGQTFLRWLHLSETSLEIAGGVILFMSALRMVFPRPEGIFGDPPGAEPFLVPLAIPSIAGPSALATVMLMASRDPARIGEWALALTAAMAATAAVLVAAHRLQAILGERVVLAFERLMGLVLTALAVEMLLGGVRAFVAQVAR